VALALTGAPLAAQADALGSVSGTITQASGGQPIAGATVYLQPQTPPSLLAYAAIQATTAADGTYNVTGVAAGQYKLVVLAHGWVQHYPGVARVAVSTGQALTGEDIALVPAGYITGTATDSSGKPLAGVAVVATNVDALNAWNQISMMIGLFTLAQANAAEAAAAPSVVTAGLAPAPGEGFTAADGTYTVDGLTAGHYILRFMLDGHWGPAAIRATLPTPTSNTVVNAKFPAGHTVTGFVKRPDGTPIAGAQVLFIDPNSYKPASPYNWLSAAITSARTLSGADGAYTIEGLPTGQIVATDGLALATVNGGYVNVAATGVTHYDFALAGNGSVSGQIKDANGVPVASAFIEVQGDNSSVGAYTLVDATGHWRVDGLPNGTYTVTFIVVNNLLADVPPGDVTVSDATPNPTIDTSLPPVSHIHGVVTDPQGKPVTGAYVTLTLGVPGTSSDLVAPPVVTYSDGAFDISGLDVNDYTIRVEAPGFATPPARAVSVTSVPQNVSQDLQLLPLSDATVPPAPVMHWYANPEVVAFEAAGPINDGGNPANGFEVRLNGGTKTCVATTSYCAVLGLTGGLTYTAKLRYRNDLGWGPYSVQRITTALYPGYASVNSWALTRGKTRIVLRAPTKSVLPIVAKIVDYKLEYKVKGVWKTYKHKRSAPLVITLSGFKVHSHYAARITPIMSKGSAETSRTFTLQFG
jgi:protocatechuate 3,4-dioxygenase beta subunit